jgi:hypothetical protein
MTSQLIVYAFDPKYTADTDGFTFDLTAWVGDCDQISATPTATISPSGAEVVSVVELKNLVTVWVSGGADNVTYTIDLHISTVAGRGCQVRGTFTNLP